jgi:hypothetical protein
MLGAMLGGNSGLLLVEPTVVDSDRTLSVGKTEGRGVATGGYKRVNKFSAVNADFCCVFVCLRSEEKITPKSNETMASLLAMNALGREPRQCPCYQNVCIHEAARLHTHTT